MNSAFHSNFYDFYETGVFTDAVITAGGVDFKVHKLILSAASDVFRAMFSTEMSEGRSGRVTIDDVQPLVFSEFLYYLYTGTSPKLKLFPVRMLTLADKYGVEELVDACESHLFETIDTTTAAEYLLAAHYLNRTGLKNRLFGFVRNRANDILVRKEWKAVAERFDLMTELILSFPEISWKNEPNIVERVTEDCLGSKVTIVWKVPSNIDEKNAISPDFDVVVNEDVKTFRFNLITSDRNRQEPFNFTVSTYSTQFEIPLVVKAEFVLSNERGHPSFRNSTTLFWDENKYCKNVADKLVFSLSKSDVNFLTRSGSDSINLSMSVQTTQTHRLVETWRTDKLPIGQSVSFKFADVRFKIDRRIFVGHRVILAGKSPYFENLFQNDDSSPSEPRIYVLTGTTNERCFEIILDYLYTERMPETKYLNYDLLESAGLYGLDKLYRTVERHLARHLTLGDALSALVVAHRLESTPVKTKALHMIKHNVKTLARFDLKWSQLSQYPELLSELLALLA